jgi:signal transduction histidine kinase
LKYQAYYTICNLQSKICNFIMTAKATTELLEAPELRDLLLDQFNLSGIIVLNKNREVVYANPKALQALELTAEEMLGKSFSASVPLLDNHGVPIPDHKRPSYKALQGTSVQAILFFCQYRLPQGGELVPLAIRAASIKRDGAVLGAIVELRRVARQLEVDQMKSLFTAFAAHQLKTPSSIVKGFLELLVRQGKEAFQPEQWNFLVSAFEANERLIRLSQTLLNIARLEGGMIEPHLVETNIEKILDNKIQSHKKTTAGALVHFKLEPGIGLSKIVTDPTFVGEVVDVFINNAVKIAPKGSTITASAQADKKQLEVSVRDQGPGMPEEILSQLRGPLAEHQPHGSPTGGNGLGLYMARKYAAALQGDITAENPESGGAKLTLVLPLVEQI